MPGCRLRAIRGAGSVHPGAIVTPFPGIGAIGRSTGYIIHPGEILADNFALMVTGRGVESPVVLRRLREVFARLQDSIPCGRAIRRRCA